MLWIWLAVERRTKLIVGYHVGKRDNAGAAALWDSLSEDCKKNGIFFISKGQGINLRLQAEMSSANIVVSVYSFPEITGRMTDG